MTSNTSLELGALTTTEFSSQPASWRHALSLSDAQLVGLPRTGERVLGLGCGTSYFMLESYARSREGRRLGRTKAAMASEAYEHYDEYEVVLLLSRSGTTTDLIRAGRAWKDRARLVAISGTPASPIEDLADVVVDLSFADDQSVVQTRFPTTALIMLRHALGDDALSTLPEQAANAIAEPNPIPPDRYQHIVFLGTAASLPLAHEAALKLREAAGLWTEAYPILEYLHGPIACASRKTLIWSFDPLPVLVEATIRSTGADVRIAVDDPLVELVRVHRTAVSYARASGIDCDTPPFLSRSVVDDAS